MAKTVPFVGLPVLLFFNMANFLEIELQACSLQKLRVTSGNCDYVTMCTLAYSSRFNSFLFNGRNFIVLLPRCRMIFDFLQTTLHFFEGFSTILKTLAKFKFLGKNNRQDLGKKSRKHTKFLAKKTRIPSTGQRLQKQHACYLNWQKMQPIALMPIIIMSNFKQRSRKAKTRKNFKPYTIATA